MPGTYFALILQELWTEVSPTGSYWMPTRVVEDTRLPAMETSLSTYRYAVPDSPGEIEIEARLVLRRAFYELMQQKGWDTPDMFMEHVITTSPLME